MNKSGSISTAPGTKNSASSRWCWIYLVRHGETHGNVLQIIQSQLDSKITDLTTEGKKQAKSLGKRLQPIKFAAVFSSDLLRARRTAEIMMLEKQLHIQIAKALRERSFGRFEGKTVAEYRLAMQHILDKFHQLPQSQKMGFKLAQDIESGEEIVSRALTFLREIAIAYLGQTVLVVTHAGVIRHILIHLGFGTHDELAPNTVANTAWVKLRSDGVDFFVEEVKGVNKQIVDK